VHRLKALRCWLPERLVLFWKEQHPGAAIQLQLDIAPQNFNPDLIQVDVA
jgi:hypothetical protein